MRKEGMIHKDDLVGKYVEFMDKQGKLRTNKVLKVAGSTLTVVDAVHKKRRVNLDVVTCQVHHGHCRREIDRSIRRKPLTLSRT